MGQGDIVVDVGAVFVRRQVALAGAERGEGVVEHLAVEVVDAQVLLGQRIVAHGGVGEELERTQISVDGVEVVT